MMKTLRVVDDGDHDERVEEREESAWSELERSTRRERPCGAIGALRRHWGPDGTDADADAQ